MSISNQAAPAWDQVSDGQLGLTQGIHQESSTQLYPLGHRVALNDGRVYHYAENGAGTLAPGKLVGSPLVFT